MPKPINYADASPAVRAVFDDIKATRKVDDVNNFWKYLANDPAALANGQGLLVAAERAYHPVRRRVHANSRRLLGDLH